jgi:uncharacterized protein (TIGR03435 family)
MTMIAVAEILTRFVDRAVLDHTGLTGPYDVVLDIAPEDFTAAHGSLGDQRRRARFRHRRCACSNGANADPALRAHCATSG